MTMLLLAIISLFTPAIAGLEKIHIEKVNLDYVSPKGAGEFEKLNLELAMLPGPYPMDVEKVGGNYVIRTPMIDLTWTRPGRFLLGLQNLILANFNADVGGKTHAVVAEKIFFNKEGDGAYRLHNLMAKCEGSSTQRKLHHRAFEDCNESMKVEMTKLEVPVDFFLLNIIKSLPLAPRVIDGPLNDFYLTSRKGDFYLYFLARYVVTASLRVWGKWHFENDFKTAVLKVNLIKFGILPVTGTVMKELKKANKDPRIKIDPPFIRYIIEE